MVGALVRILRPVLPAVSPTPADRRIVLLMWLAGVVQGYAGAHAVHTLPFARVALDLTEGQMSGVLSVTRTGALLALFFSIWGDARGRRTPYLVGFTLLVTAAAATGLAQNPASYLAAQIGVRLGGAAAGILGAVIILETVTPGIRAYALSLYAAAASLGAGLATVAVGFAGLHPDAWRVIFASSLAGILLVPGLIRHLRPGHHEPGPPGDWWRRLTVGRRRSFAVVSAASFLIAALTAVAVSFSFERLIDDVGMSATAAAGTALAGGTVGGLGFLVGGRLADTWGRRNTALVALGFAVSGSLGLYHLETPVGLALSILVSSAGSFMLAPSLGALRNELFPGGVRSRAVAWINNLAVMGSVFGLSVGQAIIDDVGLTRTVTLLAALACLAFILLPLLPETKPQGSKTDLLFR